MTKNFSDSFNFTLQNDLIQCAVIIYLWCKAWFHNVSAVLYSYVKYNINILVCHLPCKPSSASRHQQSLLKDKVLYQDHFYGLHRKCVKCFHRWNYILLDMTTTLIIIQINDTINVCCKNSQLLHLHSSHNKSQMWCNPCKLDVTLYYIAALVLLMEYKTLQRQYCC